MTLQWSEYTTLKFLEEYKKHDCLWNQNSTQYWDCCAKKEAVRAIINKLNIPTLTESKCQKQIEAITKKYDQEQSKILHGLYSGKIYKSKLLWYPLMQDMLTKTLSDKKNDKFKVTICTNSDNKKNIQTLYKKKKTRSYNSSQITYNSCGYKIVRKVAVPEEIKRPRKKPKKKRMTEKYIQCPSYEMNSFKTSNDERETVKSKDQNIHSQQSVCVREIKKRDVPRISTLNTKSAECSSCCKNSENFQYNYNPSRNMSSYSSYFNKSNNLDLNYNDLNYKSSNDRHRYRTRYVNCPNSLKTPDQLFSTCEGRNPYNFSKNLDNYPTADRIVCTNKNMELYPCQESPEQDTNVNKTFCVRNRDNSIKHNKGLSFTSNANDKHCCLTSDDQRVVQFLPRVATRFENGVLEAYSQFKISIQCDRGQNKQKINEAATQETQTAFEKKQQAVSTDVTTYNTKETQCEETATQSRQTGIDDQDLNTKQIPKTVCVSCDQTDQTDEINDELSDYFLLMPGGKCVKLAQKIFTNENFVPCPGANDSSYDDESFSVCTETSCIAQDSKLVDANIMTTPELLECVENILRINSNSEVQEEEILNSQSSSRTKNREIDENECVCKACKSNEVVDEDFKFCFEKLFNKKLSNSDCFPCLKEKLDKTGDLTKTFLYILKYALGSKAENGSRFKSKNTKEIIKKLCKCVKKLSDIEVVKEARSKNKVSTEGSISQNVNSISSQTGAENEPSISRSVNAIPENVGIETETEKIPIISRSMNTFVEEIPVETLLQNEGTNTNFSPLQKEAETNTIEKTRFQDASTQSRLIKKSNDKEKTTENQYRDPILIRVISSSDRERAKTQSQSSEYSTSESEDFRRNGLKQICFNDQTKFLLPKKYVKCGENRVISNKDWTKVKISDKSNVKINKKLLRNNFTEGQKVRNIENRKIFFNDFFN